MSEEVKNEHNKQEETLYCECCGECIWDEDVYGNSNITLCHHYTDSVNGGHNSCKTTQNYAKNAIKPDFASENSVLSNGRISTFKSDQ